MDVSTDVSVVSAIAASARRSRRKRPTSSAAMCCASAALPPLPKKRILPPERSVPAAMSTSRANGSAIAARLRAATARCSSNARSRQARPIATTTALLGGGYSSSRVARKGKRGAAPLQAGRFGSGALDEGDLRPRRDLPDGLEIVGVPSPARDDEVGSPRVGTVEEGKGVRDFLRADLF